MLVIVALWRSCITVTLHSRGVIHVAMIGLFFAANMSRAVGVTQDASCDAGQNSEAVSLNDAVIRALSNEPHLSLAKLDVDESKANLRAAKTPFLPKGQLLLNDERFVPNGQAAPVTVVGNNILGGTRTYSAYGSVSVSWNVMNSGKDIAGYHGAQAGLRAATAALFSQLDDSLSAVLKAYADLYEAHLGAAEKGQTVYRLRMIESRATERFEHGDGTTIAIGQAREAALGAEQELYESCSSLTEKSLAFAKALGVRLPEGKLLLASAPLPTASGELLDLPTAQMAVDEDPEVVLAKEKVSEAEDALKQTHAAFGPSISIDARRDYLGQSPESLGGANRAISPNSYRVGVSVVQPIMPFTAESSAIYKARAELKKSQIGVEEARSDADSRLRMALAAEQEANASYRAALASANEAQHVVSLTQSLRSAGRTDLDSLEHAELDLEKAQVQLRMLTSHRALTEWDTARAYFATRFAFALLHDLGIEMNDAIAN